MRLALDSYFPYVLRASDGWDQNLSLRKREGALIRFRSVDDSSCFGYSDCHPWPEWGHAPLMDQLAYAKQNKPTRLFQQVKKFAELDAIARSKGRLLWSGMGIPESHFLVPSLRVLFSDEDRKLESILEQGFTCLKIKAGLDEGTHVIRLLPLCKKKKLKVRIDFNSGLSWESLCDFLSQAREFLDVIDLIEDPFPFDPQLWQAVEDQFPVSLALDRKTSPTDEHRVMVEKPLFEEQVPSSLRKRTIVTSSLGHPLGQLQAAWYASQCTREVCGLLSHGVYQVNSFSKLIHHQGGIWIPPDSGTGFGWDSALEEVPWISF